MDYFDDINFIYINKIRAHQSSAILQPSSFSLEFLREGELILCINGKKKSIVAPAAFWMLPGNRYQIIPDGEESWIHCWADFSGDSGEKLIKSIHKKYQLVL